MQYVPDFSRLAYEGAFSEDSQTVFRSHTCFAYMFLLAGYCRREMGSHLVPMEIHSIDTTAYWNNKELPFG